MAKMKKKAVAKSRGATGKATYKGRAVKTKQRKYVSA